MITTPATCHHTLMSPRILMTLTPNVLSKPWAISTSRKIPKIPSTVSRYPSSNMRMK